MDILLSLLSHHGAARGYGQEPFMPSSSISAVAHLPNSWVVNFEAHPAVPSSASYWSVGV